MFSVKAKIYVDCTGDGDLCAFGGGKFEKGDENGVVMPQTLCSLWINADKSKVKYAPNHFVEQAYKDGVLSKEDRHIPGFFYDQKNLGRGNIGHTFDIDPTDETSLTKAMIDGRSMMVEYDKYFKTYFGCFDDLELVATANVLGVRESRRIICDYMLNIDDFIKRSVFDDEIGRYCYPVDIHVKSTDKAEFERFEKEYKETLKYKKGESYGIPYRSLIPVSFSNALVAGRCMGTDTKMQASIRVMPGCFITGQAAGVAAALAADTLDTRKIDIKELQKKLKELGAYLPNS